MSKQNLKHEVFELLSKGLFICSNSADHKIQKLYNYIEEELEKLKAYFEEINLVLEQGDEFFYFSRKENKVDIKRKLEKAMNWIDILDFFKSFDHSFSSGFRLTASDVQVRLKLDASLKNKLKNLKHLTKTDTELEAIDKLIDMLRKEGYAELENENTKSYKIVSSFSYLEQLILNIHIPEDIQDEIPQ